MLKIAGFIVYVVCFDKFVREKGKNVSYFVNTGANVVCSDKFGYHFDDFVDKFATTDAFTVLSGEFYYDFCEKVVRIACVIKLLVLFDDYNSSIPICGILPTILLRKNVALHRKKECRILRRYKPVLYSRKER